MINKKIKSAIFGLMLISLIAFFVFFYLEKTKPSIKVCAGPDNCKIVYGAKKEDVKNIIGYPADFHREMSSPKIDTDQDFINGYFDEKTFYYKHKNKVFYFINAKIRTGFTEDTGELLNSDAKTFEIIDANFAKDKRNVYARPDLKTSIAYQIIEGADPKTFTPLDFPYAKDVNNVYYLNHVINADVATFKILDNKLCGQDKDNYFKDGEIGREEDCR